MIYDVWQAKELWYMMCYKQKGYDIWCVTSKMVMIYDVWQAREIWYEGESIKNQPNLFLGEINLFFFNVIAL